jgi:hypothetical protein
MLRESLETPNEDNVMRAAFLAMLCPFPVRLHAFAAILCEGVDASHEESRGHHALHGVPYPCRGRRSECVGSSSKRETTRRSCVGMPRERRETPNEESKRYRRRRQGGLPAAFARPTIVSVGVHGASAAGGASSTVPTPTANTGLDALTALLFSNNAPQATAKSSDAKAVWACVPARFAPTAPELLIYYHGMNNYVTAMRDGSGQVTGYKPSYLDSKLWDKKTSPSRYSGHKYKFDAIDTLVSSARASVPMILIPEILKSDGSCDHYDAGGGGGLEAMVNDCLDGLLKLAKPGGSSGNYLTQQLHATDFTRVFLIGHSAGGNALFNSCTSTLCSKVPTTLVSFDSTYDDHAAQATAFANLRNIGMGTGDDRAVLVYTPGWNYVLSDSGKKKKKDGVKEGDMDESDFAQSGGKRVVKWWTKTYSEACFNALLQKYPDPANQVQSAPANAALAPLLGRSIVCINTGTAHDDIPAKFYPPIVEVSTPAPASAGRSGGGGAGGSAGGTGTNPGSH